jgi:hypothetical protein
VQIFKILGLTLTLCSIAFGGELRDGILHVDGKPFFPMGGWGGSTPAEVTRYGFNSVLTGAPRNLKAAERTRKTIRTFGAAGIQCVPYLSYGGASLNPWSEDQINAAASLGNEPNLLAWYTGDDIVEKHLEGMRWRVSKLRKVSPKIPTVADYIAKPGKDAKRTFTKYIDIRCQYTYPVSGSTMIDYFHWYNMQREFVGDPLWTWIQAFAWGSDQEKYNLGIQGYGPLPTPEQVYVMCYIGLNRGLRGLWIYPHRGLPRLPGVAAAVSRVCRESAIFNDHLAAGSRTFDLTVSDTTLKATAINYKGSTVAPLVVVKDFYARWVDEAVMTDQWVDIPWKGGTPRAVLIQTPDLVECPVTVKAGVARVRIPRIELAGYLYLTSDWTRIEALRTKVSGIARDMCAQIVPAASVQGRVTKNVMWLGGWDGLSVHDKDLLEMSAQIDECAELSASGDATGAFRTWKKSQLTSRKMITRVMSIVPKLAASLTSREIDNLESPYALFNLGAIANLPSKGEAFRFVRDWDLVGPFPLEWKRGLETEKPVTPGFDRVYGPEKVGTSAPYASVDGKAEWRRVHGKPAGLIDFLPEFRTVDNVVAYARVIVTVPKKMKTTAHIGHNDGAKVFVNGQQVYSLNRGGYAVPNEHDLPLELNKGDNIILVKLTNLGGRWKLFFSIDDAEKLLKFSVK